MSEYLNFKSRVAYRECFHSGIQSNACINLLKIWLHYIWQSTEVLDMHNKNNNTSEIKCRTHMWSYLINWWSWFCRLFYWTNNSMASLSCFNTRSSMWLLLIALFDVIISPWLFQSNNLGRYFKRLIDLVLIFLGIVSNIIESDNLTSFELSSFYLTLSLKGTYLFSKTWFITAAAQV